MKKAFTLVELIISIMISAIILFIVISFVNNVFDEIKYTNKKTDILKSFYDIETTFKNKKNKFLSGSILIDNNTGSGTDVLLLNTIT
jgi:prepilin-type N-terminal cleavage/methylation domain-containing protein